MNRLFLRVILLSVFVIALVACNSDDIDDVYPVIDMTSASSFPQNCDTIYTGETFTFVAQFSDNRELGAFSIDIHHNFDHHSHSTEVSNCEMGDVKEPTDDVFLYIQTWDIPEDSKNHQANIDISVPEGVDAGDYHFFIALTDREGWQTVRGISIKIGDRPVDN